jgi:hypothetical protein
MACAGLVVLIVGGLLLERTRRGGAASLLGPDSPRANTLTFPPQVATQSGHGNEPRSSDPQDSDEGVSDRANVKDPSDGEGQVTVTPAAFSVERLVSTLEDPAFDAFYPALHAKELELDQKLRTLIAKHDRGASTGDIIGVDSDEGVDYTLDVASYAFAYAWMCRFRLEDVSDEEWLTLCRKSRAYRNRSDVHQRAAERAAAAGLRDEQHAEELESVKAIDDMMRCVDEVLRPYANR